MTNPHKRRNERFSQKKVSGHPNGVRPFGCPFHLFLRGVSNMAGAAKSPPGFYYVGPEMDQPVSVMVPLVVELIFKITW